jgi:tetratricopeptide (TPR) repeat protein/ribosomal protein S25
MEGAMADIVKPSSPPFLFTYWNPFSRDSNLVESWFDYVKNVSLAKYAAQSVARYTQEASSDQMRAVDTVGERICGSLYTGFPALDSHLSLISGELERISGAFDGVNQRLDLLLDEAKTSNLLQENIAELLRIPDSQKQRQHHIEMGLKFLKNALNDEDLYQDALHELLEAEKLMPYDYFVLHRIGMIYLYVPRHGNLEKATVYFTKAAKYAAVESDPKADRLSSVLNKRVAERFSAQAELTASNISTLAAESYLQAAAGLYALGQFPEAATLAEKAVKHAPEEAKHHFFFAKYLVRSGNPDAAVPELKKAVELAPAMALAAVTDFDLNRVQAILDLLARFDAEATEELKTGIAKLNEVPMCCGYSPEDFQRLGTDAQHALEKGNYVEKTTLAARLTEWQRLLPFAVELANVAAFGIAFDAASAATLIQSAKPEIVEMEWLKRILDGFCLPPELQIIAALPNPTFSERVLLATAKGTFRPYHDRVLVERCIKGWLSLYPGKELCDVDVWNLMRDDSDGWKNQKRALQELVDNGVLWSLGDRQILYELHAVFTILIDLGLTCPKIQPENSKLKKSSDGFADELDEQPIHGLPDELDEELIEQCIEIIRSEQRASVSLLQRRLRLGYTRAARIMDELEERGIVGPNKGAEPRDILIDLDGGGAVGNPPQPASPIGGTPSRYSLQQRVPPVLPTKDGDAFLLHARLLLVGLLRQRASCQESVRSETSKKADAILGLQVRSISQNMMSGRTASWFLLKLAVVFCCCVTFIFAFAAIAFLLGIFGLLNETEPDKVSQAAGIMIVVVCSGIAYAAVIGARSLNRRAESGRTRTQLASDSTQKSTKHEPKDS